MRIFFKRVAQPLGSDPICRLSSVPRKELRKTCGLKEIPVNDGLQAWFRCLFFFWGGGVSCNDVSNVKKRPGQLVEVPRGKFLFSGFFHDPS